MMFRFISLVLSVCLAASPLAQASTVLIQGGGTSPGDYRAMIRADAGLVSVTEKYVQQHPLPGSREKLLATFSKAQADFLGASTETAAASFKAVAELWTADDWIASDRSIFQTAFLRLAQLQPAQADEWLKLSLSAGADLSPDATLFPPPILERRTALARDSVRIPASADWDLILVNGQACRTDCGNWPRASGPVRVTFISNRWVTQTLTVKAEKAAQLKPKTLAWASGDCRAKSAAPAAEKFFGTAQVFWGLDCNQEPTRDLKLAPRATPSAFPTVAESRTEKPFYKSPWVWAGVAAITAFVIISSKQHQKSTESTTTYGLQ